jgi:hypothetical protein
LDVLSVFRHTLNRVSSQVSLDFAVMDYILDYGKIEIDRRALTCLA